MNFPKLQGFVRTFVFICVGVWLLEQFSKFGPFGSENLFAQLNYFLGLVPQHFFKGMVYQPITWMFLHGSMWHLIFNMLGLWMFGSLLEETWGTKRFIKFVFISGYLSGLIVALFGLVDHATFMTPTIGASGMIFATLIAVSRLYPDQMVLAFFVFPMRMRYFIYLIVAMEFFALSSSNDRGVSNVAHLGGAIVGYFYVLFTGRRRKSLGKESWYKQVIDRWHQRRMRKKLRIVRRNETRHYH